jgi:type IV secretion system protein VirD4
MYRLSRLLLILSTAAGGYCACIVAILGWPASGVILAIILVARVARKKQRHLTTLGSARWADEGDLRKAGMLDAPIGLILGRLPAARPKHRLGKLFQSATEDKEACQNFWSPLRNGKGPLVRLPQAIHSLIVSPSGGGKGVSCVIPFLLTCPESCVVVDFKGENALRTARHRRKMFGHQIVLLDPFHVVTKTPDCFNPLDFIDKNGRNAIDHCNDLANALVIRTGEEREPHWNDSAEAWIAAVLATVVQYGGRDASRSLQTVRDILSHPQKLDMAIKLMCESECWGGMLARMGGQLLHFVDKEKSSTLTTVSRHLRFLDSLAVANSTKASSFDPGKLRNGKTTVYLVLPPEHMRAQSPLLRVWIGSLLRAVVAGGLQERNKVHFVIDEAASLGHLDAIDDAVDKYRGYGVRLQFYLQSLGQLKKCFPDGQEQTLLSNTSQVFFGVNDNATADYTSARLGESTIIVESGGSGSSSSTNWSYGAQPQQGYSGSYNSNYNWQQQPRKLLKPEEVIALSPRTAITLTPGVAPVSTTLLRYYEEPGLGRRNGWLQQSFAACCTLAASLVLCAAGIGSAALLTVGGESGVKQQLGIEPPPAHQFNAFEGQRRTVRTR